MVLFGVLRRYALLYVSLVVDCCFLLYIIVDCCVLVRGVVCRCVSSRGVVWCSASLCIVVC